MFCRSLCVLMTIVLSVLLWFTASGYPFGILWPLCCMSLFDLRPLVTPLVSYDHCVVCASLIYGLWLPLWYLRFTASGYPFGILWPLCCMSLFDLRPLVTPLVSYDHCVVCASLIYGLWLPLWYLRFTASGYLFGIFKLI